MTPDLTREEMLERLMRIYYDALHPEDLFSYFKFYKRQDFADWSNEEVETVYKEYFPEK